MTKSFWEIGVFRLFEIMEGNLQVERPMFWRAPYQLWNFIYFISEKIIQILQFKIIVLNQKIMC